MYNITKDIENEIIDAINPIIDEYLQGRTVGTQHAKNVISRKDYDSYFDGVKKTIYDAKKEFLKPKAISRLIEDINWTGYRNHAKISGVGDSKLSEQRYRELVVKLLNDTIRDRIAVEKDKQVMEIKKFESFDKTDLNLLISEIKNMSENEVDEMLNEGKLSLEKIAYELTYQRVHIEKIEINLEKINDILSRNNLK